MAIKTTNLKENLWRHYILSMKDPLRLRTISPIKVVQLRLNLNQQTSKMKFFVKLVNSLTLFRMEGGGQKAPPYQFFPCNFYKSKNLPPKLPDF